MSKHEQGMVERYWRTMGGGLFLEYPLVRRSRSVGSRWVDGLNPRAIEQEGVWRWSEATRRGISREIVRDRDVIVVQAKYQPKRLCMPLLGQTFFAVELLKDLAPASVRGVALCREDDVALRRVFERFPGMEVVVDEP